LIEEHQKEFIETLDSETKHFSDFKELYR